MYRKLLAKYEIVKKKLRTAYVTSSKFVGHVRDFDPEIKPTGYDLRKMFMKQAQYLLEQNKITVGEFLSLDAGSPTESLLKKLHDYQNGVELEDVPTVGALDTFYGFGLYDSRSGDSPREIKSIMQPRTDLNIPARKGSKAKQQLARSSNRRPKDGPTVYNGYPVKAGEYDNLEVLYLSELKNAESLLEIAKKKVIGHSLVQFFTKLNSVNAERMKKSPIENGE